MKSRLPVLLSLAVAMVAPAVFAQQAQVDPYTGQAISLETLSRNLDTAKMETALLEEKVKEAHLKRELDALSPTPAQAHTGRAHHVDSGRQGRKVRERSAPAVEASAPQISAVSILSIGGTRTALLKVDGRTLSVRDGQMTSYGKVVIPDNRQLFLGTRSFIVP